MDKPDNRFLREALIAERRKREDGTIRRLHSLVGKGYTAQLGASECMESIWLESPANRAPSLTLYSDGLLVASLQKINPRGGEDANAIGNETAEDDWDFRRFLDSLPKPTWRERTAEWRAKYVWAPIFLVALYGTAWLLALGAMRLLSGIWHSL